MQADLEKPGYRHIIFKPLPAGDITFVRYYNQTPYGRAGIMWKKENSVFTVDITVPVGCEATLYLPLMKNGHVSEGDGRIEISGPDLMLSETESYRIVEIKSGDYRFISS
jgi:alpha-L-rhamnosidase